MTFKNHIKVTFKVTFKHIKMCTFCRFGKFVNCKQLFLCVNTIKTMKLMSNFFKSIKIVKIYTNIKNCKHTCTYRNKYLYIKVNWWIFVSNSHCKWNFDTWTANVVDLLITTFMTPWLLREAIKFTETPVRRGRKLPSLQPLVLFAVCQLSTSDLLPKTLQTELSGMTVKENYKMMNISVLH